MMLGLSASSSRAGAGVRCAKIREQICAPNLPILTEQTSPSVTAEPAPKPQWRQRLDRTVHPVPPAGMAGIRASLFIGRRPFNSPLGDASTAEKMPLRHSGNAIKHSGGSCLKLGARRTPAVGSFRRVARVFAPVPAANAIIAL